MCEGRHDEALMTQPAEGTLVNTALYWWMVCMRSNFNVCFEFEPSGVGDGPLSQHVEHI